MHRRTSRFLGILTAMIFFYGFISLWKHTEVKLAEEKGSLTTNRNLVFKVFFDFASEGKEATSVGPDPIGLDSEVLHSHRFNRSGRIDPRVLFHDIVFDTPKLQRAPGKLPIIQVFFDATAQCPEYLRANLWQARQHNDEVILLGASACESYCKRIGVRFHAVKHYFAEAHTFSATHPSAKQCAEKTTRQHALDLMTVQRWFVLREYMRRHRIGRVFYADADTLLFHNVTALDITYFAESELALTLTPPNISVSFAIMSLEALDDWLEFAKSYYRDVHAARAVPVCTTDMALIKAYVVRSALRHTVDCGVRSAAGEPISDCFRRDGPGVDTQEALIPKHEPRYNNITSLAYLLGNAVTFDPNLDSNDMHGFKTIPGGVMEPGSLNRLFKQVTWRALRPYFTTLAGREIQVAGLHFAGKKKPYAINYVRDVRAPPRTLGGVCVCASHTCEECVADAEPAVDRIQSSRGRA